jgi:hypothetical protein
MPLNQEWANHSPWAGCNTRKEIYWPKKEFYKSVSRMNTINFRLPFESSNLHRFQMNTFSENCLGSHYG